MDYRNNNAVLREVVITQCGVRIQADEARISGGLDFENSHWTISGNVRITSEGGSLSSDKAVVAFPQQTHFGRDHHRHACAVRAAARRRHHRARPRQYDRLRNCQRHRELQYQRLSGLMAAVEVTGQQFAYNIRTQSMQQGQSKPGASERRRPGALRDPAGQAPQSRSRTKEKEKRTRAKTVSVLRATHLAKSLQKAPGDLRPLHRSGERADRRVVRTERRGQDHGVLHDRRPGSARSRHSHHRRPGHHAPRDASARACRHRLPAAGSLGVPQVDRRRQRHGHSRDS